MALRVQSAVSLFKTPERSLARASFDVEQSPSDRSTIPQLFTPDITVLDLDASIKWRGGGEAGMSPLPAVTPLVASMEPSAIEFRGLQQRDTESAQCSTSMRSHRTLDFSNANGCATFCCTNVAHVTMDGPAGRLYTSMIMIIIVIIIDWILSGLSAHHVQTHQLSTANIDPA